MFGNNKQTEMSSPTRKSSRDFAKARKLDEKELTQALIDIGMWKPLDSTEVITPIPSLSSSTSPENKK